ncbi:hypothetical protein [Photobacterium leiognathi]|nr:hypothetical protein [Photobacterium leiognathi]KJF85392.1 hypothetical protein UB42_20000 [Photobacterium leiognathi]
MNILEFAENEKKKKLYNYFLSKKNKEINKFKIQVIKKKLKMKRKEIIESIVSECNVNDKILEYYSLLEQFDYIYEIILNDKKNS